MKDVFLLASAIVFVVSSLSFLAWPGWWASVIRESHVHGEFWSGSIGMAISKLLAVIALLTGVLILLGYVL